MSIDILINSRSYEVRLALVENSILTEFHMQRPMEKGLKGNIYRGRVVRVLPGMQAAFVDIGLERTGFLYVDDVHISEKDIENRMLGREPSPAIDELSPIPGETGSGRSHGSNIEDLLTEGQDVLVQVSKDPIGTKGARLTCHITLPCRNLVFIPLTDHIGVSRKIENEEIRTILKEQIEEIRPQGTGFIVRTVAEHAKVEELEADMEFLMLLWDEIRDLARSSKSPALVYEDLDITLRSVRDLFTNDVDRLIIDDKTAHEKLLHFVRAFAPQLQDRISLYQGESPLFEAHGIEVEINRAIEKKVWLRSGGYIIIESTEALSVIDVNKIGRAHV